ncbi:MAG: hypothetical protein HOO90_03420 [Methylotenera sp.]|uniref:hypothetical protein n=1 Tax=Methylotenera sp. TaxID=2051956 RepID=UPI00183D46DD|nr:hypothetical protein [Methylotenera sp.]NOU24566.1 hypothetical protein [Methylotenera sp.]
MCDYKKIFSEVLATHNNHAKWDDSAFGRIKTISNTKVGTVGQDFVEKMCKALGIDCFFPLNENGKRLTQSPWDMKINNVTFELKTATEDTNGKFQFNHIRYHRPYEAVLCLGVSPNSLHFGVWSKADVVTGKAGNLVSMEKGANASYKLTKAPKDLIDIKDFKKRIEEFTAAFK